MSRSPRVPKGLASVRFPRWSSMASSPHVVPVAASMKPSCGPPGWDVRRSLERGRTRLPSLDLGLTSKVQADRGGRLMLTIGKLAHSAGVSSDTLRYYEREGLIEPAGKSPAGYRLYDKDSARRLRFIRQAQQCGFTLAEIRTLLILRGRDAARCGDVRKRAIEKKQQLEGKIRSMRAMCKALDRLIAGCVDETRPVEGCAIVAAFEQPETPARTH